MKMLQQVTVNALETQKMKARESLSKRIEDIKSQREILEMNNAITEM